MAATEDDLVCPQKPRKLMSRELYEEDRREIMTHSAFGLLIGLSIVLLLIVHDVVSSGKDATTFSMELAGLEGLNATLRRTLLLCMLRTPAFFNRCATMAGRWWCPTPMLPLHGVIKIAQFLVLPWGRGVGLPEDMRRRLTSDWQTGKAQVMVELKVFYDDKVRSQLKYDGAILHSCQLSLGNKLHVI
ncbi:hypothetical protein EJB05_17230, partial [Eragrostis curvula]